MTGDLLEVRDLSVRYGPGRPALSDFSLSLEPGETVGLMGPSGSGKSTVAWAVLGFLPPGAQVDGTIRSAGKMSMVPQEPSSALSPFLRIGTQMDEVQRGAAAAMLERVGLPQAMLRAYPHEVSGGELQRVALAQALLRRPAVLFADEPASALDRQSQANVCRLLRDLQQEMGFAMVLISHEPAMIEEFAERVVVLENGRIVEEGSRASVFDNPKAEFTRTVMSLWRW